MSRSNYSYDLDNWALIKWRGQVTSAIRGKRGQQLLRDLLAALDAMPQKCLIADDLETSEGEYCALGALGKYRGIELQSIDPHDYFQVAEAFGVANQLTQEIVYENDEGGPWKETTEHRWQRMRAWVSKNIKDQP